MWATCDKAASVDLCYREGQTQCTQYDIMTSPLISEETQTYTGRKSKNIQTDCPVKEKSAQAVTAVTSMACNTETSDVVECFTMTDEFKSDSSQTNWSADKACQIATVAEEKGTMSRDLIMKRHKANQSVISSSTTGTMTDDIWELVEGGDGEYLEYDDYEDYDDEYYSRSTYQPSHGYNRGPHQVYYYHPP